jgi:mannose-6-phosphate isomerase-like protein (cupin superfamily)
MGPAQFGPCAVRALRSSGPAPFKAVRRSDPAPSALYYFRFPQPGAPLSGPVAVKHVPKPWGYETIWALTDRYCGKVLHINAGHALSVQYHDRKDETVHLLSGQLVYWVKVDGEMRDMRLQPGQSFRITPGTVHYMEAITDCDILEASTPELDDVVRLEDRYGREGTNAP